jgi:hypothetical protein
MIFSSFVAGFLIIRVAHMNAPATLAGVFKKFKFARLSSYNFRGQKIDKRLRNSLQTGINCQMH